MQSSDNVKMIDSILSTKAVGSVANISADLSLPEGQDIIQLLNQHEKENYQKSQKILIDQETVENSEEEDQD